MYPDASLLTLCRALVIFLHRSGCLAWLALSRAEGGVAAFKREHAAVGDELVGAVEGAVRAVGRGTDGRGAGLVEAALEKLFGSCGEGSETAGADAAPLLRPGAPEALHVVTAALCEAGAAVPGTAGEGACCPPPATAAQRALGGHFCDRFCGSLAEVLETEACASEAWGLAESFF